MLCKPFTNHQFPLMCMAWVYYKLLWAINNNNHGKMLPKWHWWSKIWWFKCCACASYKCMHAWLANLTWVNIKDSQKLIIAKHSPKFSAVRFSNDVYSHRNTNSDPLKVTYGWQFALGNFHEYRTICISTKEADEAETSIKYSWCGDKNSCHNSEATVLLWI